MGPKSIFYLLVCVAATHRGATVVAYKTPAEATFASTFGAGTVVVGVHIAIVVSEGPAGLESPAAREHRFEKGLVERGFVEKDFVEKEPVDNGEAHSIEFGW